MVARKPGEELIVYLSASYEAVSAVLMTERDTVQTPVYFISRALRGLELNYTPIEKLILALVCAAKILRSIMQGEHKITYRSRTSVKGQVLADFLVEKPNDTPPQEYTPDPPQEPLTLFTDGSSCVDGSGLRIAAHMGVRNVHVSVDSKLVGNQVLGTHVAKEENMVKYLDKVKTLVSGFAGFSITQVPRSQNKKVDALSKIASTSFAHLSKQQLVKVLQEKSIQEKDVAAVVEEEGPTWMTPIEEYLKEWILSEDKKQASRLRLKARQYELLDGILYRRSFLNPWLRCVGPRSVVAKAMWSGYYWPTMHWDAHDLICKCKDCQDIDIAGPFPEGPGKVKFLIVAMDYFTKCVEAKAVATIIGSQDNKIDLLVQQHEQFAILEAESIDSGFARFNTIVTSLKALDQSFSSKNYVRKFLRALHPKQRAKVTPIEESKDLSSLSLDELIGNLKVHEMIMEKDSEIYKGKKDKIKSIALKAKKESSDDETSTSESDDEEYAMAVRNFKKFLRRKGKSVRQPREERKVLRQRDENKVKSDRTCFKCGDPNHLIGDCPKSLRVKDQKALVRRFWSDSEDEADDEVNDKTCLMAQSSSEVTPNSSWFIDNTSTIENDNMQLEYDNLCEFSLRIINKNKILKNEKEILEKEILKLKSKIVKLDKNKKIENMCELCQELRLENTQLKETQVKIIKFDESTSSLKEMLSNQKNFRNKDGLGFDSSKTSTNETKFITFVKSSGNNSTDGSVNQIDESIKLGGSVKSPDELKFTECIFNTPMSSRPNFSITRKKLIHNMIDESKRTLLKPSQKNGLGYNKPELRSKTPPPRRNNSSQSRRNSMEPILQNPYSLNWNNNQNQGFVCLKTRLEPDEWIKDSGCSKHMTGNKSLFSTYKAYDGENVVFGSSRKGKIIGKGKTPYEIYRGRKPSLEYFKVFGSKCFILNTKDYLTKFDLKSYEGVFLGYSQNSKAYIVLNKHSMKVEESLNVTFDESPPPSKLSPLVDDDVCKEESIEKHTKITNDVVKEDESLEVEKSTNIRESKNHPLDQVIGNLNQRTLRSQAQNQIPLPSSQSVIGTRWIFRNKLDENGIVSRNKARLVAQGYNQQEGIDYDETYAPVARLESIRILLAIACANDFKLYQMDVKSAFLNGFINEEVYVAQPPGFIDFEKPNYVYKLKKALYGLKQAPKAWYDRLKSFLIKHEYSMGMVDNTLFTKKSQSDLIIVQIYVDDIIFGSTFEDAKPIKTPMSTEIKLMKDDEANSVDSTKYRENPKTTHLEAVKRIFRYIRGTMHLGLWYPKGTGIETIVYADSDHAGDYVDRKSTSGVCTFVGCCLTSWFAKKQTALAISTTEAEYVSVEKACQQALWMKQALFDYDILLNDIPIMCDNKGAIDLRFSIRGNNFTMSLEKFGQILEIPYNNACVFSNEYPLELLNTQREKYAPYQSCLPYIPSVIQSICTSSSHQNYSCPTIILRDNLLPEIKDWELIIRENVICVSSNKHSLDACTTIMLYNLVHSRPFNLAYFIAHKIEDVKNQVNGPLPYGLLLTRLYRYILSLHPKIFRPHHKLHFVLHYRMMNSIYKKNAKRKSEKEIDKTLIFYLMRSLLTSPVGQFSDLADLYVPHGGVDPAKVTTIEESKDLSSLSLDELIGNLKVHEMIMEKDFEIYKGKKDKIKSIALKAKKESSDDETLTSESDDEEYAMAVRNFKKFLRRKGKSVRQPREERKVLRQRDENKVKSDRTCFKCGDPNHLIGDCPKSLRVKDQKALVRRFWSDSEDDADDEVNDKTCLMAQSSSEAGYPMIREIQGQRSNPRGACEESLEASLSAYIKSSSLTHKKGEE
ncbi:retrovirus-related pol polyprotein from transposon TNT 1-94 [Tanacetum coccineum]